MVTSGLQKAAVGRGDCSEGRLSVTVEGRGPTGTPLRDPKGEHARLPALGQPLRLEGGGLKLGVLPSAP